LIGGASTIIPGAKFLDPLANAGARKILGTKAGQAIEGLAASRGIDAGTAISSAIRGAGAMGTYGAIQQGIGEALNPNEATFGQRALNVGAQAAAGAVLDPALSSIGGTIANSAIGQRFANMLRPKPQTTPSQELLGLPGPQEQLRLNGPQQPLMLNAPQQALPAPAPVEPTINNFNNFGKMPTGLQSPIPQMPRALGEVLPKKPVVETNPVDYKALEDNFVKQQLSPHYEYQKQAAEAETKWQTTVNAAKDEISRIKESFGKIYVPKDAMEDYQVPKQFLAGGKDKHSDDIFSFADQMGFSSPDEAVQYLKALDEESKTRLKDLMPSGQNMIPEKDLRYREEALRKEFRAKNPQPAPPKQEQTALDIPQIAPQDRKVSRLATFDEMYQRMQDTAPPKQESKPLNPLEFKREKGYDLLPKIKNRNGEKPATTEKKSSLLLPLKPVHLKTVKVDKSVHIMNKKELQGIYQELKTKKETFAKTKNQKKMKQVDEDIKQVEGLLMKLDLQLFGKSEPKPVAPKLKAGGDAAKTENISPAPKVKDPKQEYAIAQSKNKKLVETYKQKNDKLKEEVAKLLSNSDQWKDKGRFQLGRETMNRNFEDIMGKDANTFKQKFLDPISSQEANRVRFLNKERDIVKTYGIKAKSEDDKLVQMYGEKKISLADLKQKTQNWKQVVKVAENYRRKYDELLTTVNKELENNGFNPIPKRADYFPHYEEVDGIMKSLGFDMENHSLPTDINGLTDQFKPNKNFFRNALQRKGDETTFGAIQGFDKYIEGISNVIYHTKNIKQLRSLDQVIRTKYAGDTKLSNFAAELTEYTNLLAGKKAKVDRAFEDRFGRKVYNAVETIRRRTGANMIGANVSSALTNFIPITQSLATTEKKAFVKGLSDTLANVVKNDGFIQQSDFLTKRIGSDPLYRTNWDKITDKSMWLMKTFDSFTSQAVTRGKYNELIAKKVPHEKAIKQADDYAARLMADRSKGSMPTLFNSKTFGILSQFQLEVNNQVSFLFKDLPRNSKNKAALASSMGQILLYSYLYNNLYEKAVGRRPAFDPIGIAFQAKKDYTNDNLSKGEATQNLTKNVLNTLPFTSIMSGGRFPIAAGVPNTNDAMAGRSSWTTELSKPLIYLGLPAGGGQLKKTYEGLTDMNKNPLEPQGTTGSYKNGKLQYPVEDSAANNTRAALFGKYSLPESNQFYDNKRSALSDKQTKMVEMNPESYNAIIQKQQLASIKNKIKEIQKDDSLTQEQKQKKLLPLFQQLQGR
jgi:hypothetical protein